MNFDKLEKLIDLHEEVNKRISALKNYLTSDNHFLPFLDSAKKKLEWYQSGKVTKKIDQIITENLIDHISLEYLAKTYPGELLDLIGDEKVHDHMEDYIESYVDSVCKVRYTERELRGQ